MFTNVSGKFIPAVSHSASTAKTVAVEAGILPNSSGYRKFIPNGTNNDKDENDSPIKDPLSNLEHLIPPVPGSTSSQSNVFVFLEECFGKYWFFTLLLILLIIYFRNNINL